MRRGGRMTTPRLCRAAGLAALSLLTLAVFGCGKSDTKPARTVTGLVKYKDQPLGGGTVTFVGPDGEKVKGTIAGDGHYLIKDPPLGKVQIGVEPGKSKPTDFPSDYA